MADVRAEPVASSHVTIRRSLLFAVAPCILPLFSAAHGASLFGAHFPHGNDAVVYLYGANGTWREQSNVYYGWNFYKHCETPAHAHNPQAMLIESSVSNSTAPDANCILLGDLDHDGEISDDSIVGFAFHEHAGRGVHGEQTAAPFYQFWFDDNWIARYVAEAYGRPHPIGLHDSGYPIRWRLIGGDNRYWTPYSASSPHIDQITFNGLYKLNAGDFAAALADWQAIKSSSGAAYDCTQRRYAYDFAAKAIYYYGLWAILSERLLAARSTFPERSDVLQHAMSLHSWLLTLQEKDTAGTRLGWRTGTLDRALINTETTSVAVLALGAHASWVLEPGYAPLSSAPGNYVRNHEVLSAVAGQSAPGHVVFGPYWTLAPGTYDVDFSLRSTAQRVEAPFATLDVYDGSRMVKTVVIEGADAPTGNQWRRYRLTAEIDNESNVTEFRVYWHGSYDLDVGAIRVSQRPMPAKATAASLAPATAPARVAPFARASRSAASTGPTSTATVTRVRERFDRKAQVLGNDTRCRQGQVGCSMLQATNVRRTSDF
jgi:hypothetical protein